VLLAVHFGSSGALDNLALRVPCVRLDFDTEDDGVTALVNGQDVASPSEFGTHVAITAAGPNAGAAIFDSTPGGPNAVTQDPDLLVGLGNLLILQNNGAPQSLVQSVPGIFDRPNDDADGGSLVFSFVQPVTARRIDLADIDPGQPNSSSVVLTDADGRTRTFTVPAGWTEDLVDDGAPGYRTLELLLPLAQPGFASVATAVEDAGFDESRVTELRVNLGSSGGVDNSASARARARDGSRVSSRGSFVRRARRRGIPHAPRFATSRSRSSRRSTFITVLFGSSARNSTSRGSL
jgi:hypothetical protein